MQFIPRLQGIIIEDNFAGKNLELFAITAWSIWNARNRFYFEQVQAHPKYIFNSAMGLLEEKNIDA